MFFTILDKYINKTILSFIMIILFIYIFFSSIIKFIDQIKRIEVQEYDVVSFIFYIILCIPKEIEVFFPIAVLIGSLIGLRILMNNNELIVMQSFGISVLQIFISILKSSILLIIISIIFNEYIVPKCEKISRNYRHQILVKNDLNQNTGFWIKDKKNFVCVINILNEKKLKNIIIYNFNNKKNIKNIIHAEFAIFNKKNFWILSNVRKTIITSAKIIQKKFIYSIWKSTLDPNKINMLSLPIKSFSITELYNFSKILEKNKENSIKYRLYMWKKIFQPFAIFIMLSMAFSIVFQRKEINNLKFKQILFAIILSFIFHIVNSIFSTISILNKFSPCISAICPIIIFLFLSIIIFYKNKIFHLLIKFFNL